MARGHPNLKGDCRDHPGVRGDQRPRPRRAGASQDGQLPDDPARTGAARLHPRRRRTSRCTGLAERSGDFMAPGHDPAHPGPRGDAGPFRQRRSRSGAIRVRRGTLLRHRRGTPRNDSFRVLVPPGRAGQQSPSIRPGRLHRLGHRRHPGRRDLARSLSHSWAHSGDDGPSAAGCRATDRSSPGQRVFDLLFPVVEGGSVAVPGGFGTGKDRHRAVTRQVREGRRDGLHRLWRTRERDGGGASTTSAVLTDPKTGRPIMDRTVLIVNTSNMPVAARDASVYLGMTIAEYYRDMGYHVAVLADSLSRWAEALREIAARLARDARRGGVPDLPGQPHEPPLRARGPRREPGHPCHARAPSPSSPRFLRPEATSPSRSRRPRLRVVGALWALDARLAHQRQFPAVDWDTSYSLYADGTTGPWFSTRGRHRTGCRAADRNDSPACSAIASCARSQGSSASTPSKTKTA